MSARPDASPIADMRTYSRAFWLVFGASFALNTVANLFVLFPLWIVDRGGTAGTIGAIIGTGSLAALASRPAVGTLIDRRGRRWTATCFLLLDAFAIALYLPLRSIGAEVFVVRAIHGAMEGTARVALFAMIYDMLPAGREGEAMSIFSLSGMVPAALGPVVGEQLILSFGFPAFFALAIVLMLLGALIARAVVEPTDHAGTSERTSAAGPGYAALISDPAMLPLWVVTLLFALAISCRLSFVAPYAYQEGVRRVGWYFAIYSIAGVTVRLRGGQLMDRIGLNRALLPSLMVLAIGLALIAGAGTTGVLDLAAAIGGIGHGYLYPALTALVIARTPARATGRSSSIYSSLYDFGTMAGPYVLGIVAAQWGYGLMFIVSGMIAVAGGIYFVGAEPTALSPLPQ